MLNPNFKLVFSCGILEKYINKRWKGPWFAIKLDQEKMENDKAKNSDLYQIKSVFSCKNLRVWF